MVTGEAGILTWVPGLPAVLHILCTALHTSALICPCFVECTSWHPLSGEPWIWGGSLAAGQPPAPSAVLVHKAQPPPRWLGQNWAAPATLVPRGGSSTPGGHIIPHPQGQGQGERLWFVRDKVPFGVASTLGWSILAASLRLVPRLWLGRVLGLASQL